MVRWLTTGLPVVVNGLPGIGKTALAITLVHDGAITAHFHDGVLWASLGRQPDFIGIAEQWCGRVHQERDCSPATSQEWTHTVREALRDRRMLIVLDDVWQAEHAQTLMLAGPACTYLITTRFPRMALVLTDHSVMTILHELGEEASMALLHWLCPQVFAACQEALVRDLAQVTGGLPAALLAMGNYLRVQSRDHPRRMWQAIQRVRSLEHLLLVPNPFLPGASGEQTCLAAMVRATLESLDASARASLAELVAATASLPDPFSRAEATSTISGDVSTFQTLLDVGLLSLIGGGYHLHPLIRACVRAVLSSNEVLLCST
jgi:hypothetical protein